MIAEPSPPPHSQQILESIRTTLLESYDDSHLLNLLLQLKPVDQEAQKQINMNLEKIFNLFIMNTLKVQAGSGALENCKLPQTSINEVGIFLKTVCKALENPAIKRTIVINFIENILECLGISDLKQILAIITEQITIFGHNLEETDQYKLLRIINHLLKRVSKTEDYAIRGQLHFTLSKFLPICHDSGFHYRTAPPKIEQASQQKQENGLFGNQELALQQNELTYEFYRQFWQLQKYFMNLQELNQSEKANPENFSPKKQSMLYLKLKHIEGIIKNVVDYFSKSPTKQTSQFFSEPLKFYRSYNLLPLQLKDPYFRKTIMIQIIIFVFSLKNPSKNINITLSQNEKKVVDDIEKIAENQIRKDGKLGEEFYEDFKKILDNQVYWIDLKDNWKERRKHFFRKQVPEQSTKKVSKQDISTKKKQIQNMINDKLKIDGSNLMSFLQTKDPIKLNQKATTTSFSYYYNQGKQCLETFDFESGKQTEFETRSEYNIFQWKAMRCLFRENMMRDVLGAQSDKINSKLKDYRILGLIQKKQEEFEGGQPKKKIKQNEKLE